MVAPLSTAPATASPEKALLIAFAMSEPMFFAKDGITKFFITFENVLNNLVPKNKIYTSGSSSPKKSNILLKIFFQSMLPIAESSKSPIP